MVFGALDAIVINNHCGRFYCPDRCNVTYTSSGCPHNCNCGKLVRCPLVRCPARSPICDVFTGLDGCQTCACKLPYAVISAEEGYEGAGFVFLGSALKSRLDQGSKLSGDKSKVLRQFECTLPHMDKIDKCMEPMVVHHKFMKSKRRDVVETMNPSVRFSANDMHSMCGYMTKSLLCIGEQAYDKCRYYHPNLAEMDALYGYPCGEKEKLFFHYLDCVQRAHVYSYRMFACEDSTYRSLGYIERSEIPLEDKQEQKCQAMTWLMRCEIPSIHRRCSREASSIYEQSLMSSTEYIAPECYPDHERQVFMVKPTNELVKAFGEADVDPDDLVPKEDLVCNDEQQEQITKYFNKLYEKVLSKGRRSSLAYPVGYEFSKRDLERMCKDYEKGMKVSASKAKRNCIRRFEVYDQVYFSLGYPCGYATKTYFLRYHKCLTSIRKKPEVRECEFLAAQRIEDPSNDLCESYQILSDCIHSDIHNQCGSDGWEMEYQYLSLSVRKFVPDCRIRRPLLMKK